MKFKFKVQPYQTHAVESVVESFKGQANETGISYRIDPGQVEMGVDGEHQHALFGEDSGFKNSDLMLAESQLLENIQAVQRQQNLPQSTELVKSKVSSINLDVEMETGTGKTYCYIKTAFEMNKRFDHLLSCYASVMR